MPRYCMSLEKDEHGDNEVHKEGCEWTPIKNRDLGTHPSCKEAVALAIVLGFKDANGCYHCCRDCHSS